MLSQFSIFFFFPLIIHQWKEVKGWAMAVVIVGLSQDMTQQWLADRNN